MKNLILKKTFFDYLEYIVNTYPDITIIITSNGYGAYYDPNETLIKIKQCSNRKESLLHELGHYLILTKYKKLCYVGNNISGEYLVEYFAYFAMGYSSKRSHKRAMTYVHKYRKFYPDIPIPCDSLNIAKLLLTKEANKIKGELTWCDSPFFFS